MSIGLGNIDSLNRLGLNNTSSSSSSNGTSNSGTLWDGYNSSSNGSNSKNNDLSSLFSSLSSLLAEDGTSAASNAQNSGMSDSGQTCKSGNCSKGSGGGQGMDFQSIMSMIGNFIKSIISSLFGGGQSGSGDAGGLLSNLFGGGQSGSGDTGLSGALGDSQSGSNSNQPKLDELL